MATTEVQAAHYAVRLAQRLSTSNLLLHQQLSELIQEGHSILETEKQSEQGCLNRLKFREQPIDDELFADL